MTRRLRHTLALLALTAVVLPLSAAAEPRDTTETASHLDSQALEQARLMRLLNSNSTAKQGRAVRLIGTYAHTGRYDTEFFDQLVTPLHGLVATSDSDGLQIMAISALSSIGSDAAIGGLRALVHDLAPDRVQRIAKNVIVASETSRIAARTQSQ